MSDDTIGQGHNIRRGTDVPLVGESGPELVDIHPPLPIVISWECTAGRVDVTEGGVTMYFKPYNSEGLSGFSLSEFQELRRIVDTARAVYEDGAKVASPRPIEVPF